MTANGIDATGRWPRYTLAQRLVHWLVAVLALLTLGIGLTLGWLGFEGARDAFGLGATNALYIAHKTIGVLLLVLMLARAALRLYCGKPAYAVALARPQRIASEIVHGLLYVLLLAMPVIGWMATAAGGFPINFFHWVLPPLIGENEALSETLYTWHLGIGLAILALVSIHVAGALYHWLIRRDGVMQRMSLLPRRSTRAAR
ncbi:MAG: cytochrome b/b6 domain-containing protein [Halofilum sp. (in: g-proteobacteria)]|nr:cytochrome b/b6 domain-containing protein [Halofilum sp. (in: g-proteobacteria)]